MKQKVLVLFIVFIFTVIPLTAKKINALAAEKAGMIHLEQQQNIWFSQLNRGLLQQELGNFSITGVSPVIDETSGDTLFYVLHLAPGGFIVVSGDTDVQPVIAYSYNSSCSLEDVSSNLLLQLLKKDIKARLSAAPSAVNNQEWETILAGDALEAGYDKNVEQWPPVGHSQYNKGWLNTDATTTGLGQILTYWETPVSQEAPADTIDISRELKETWRYNSAKVEKYFDSNSFFPGLIDNMRRGWPVQLALQIENSGEISYVFCDGYRKTGSGEEYFHLKTAGEWGTWYSLKDSGHFIKYGVMDIHPDADLHEPNNKRHDAFPIQASEFAGKAGIWETSEGTKIKPSHECDWYRFEAKAGEKVIITFRGNWTEAAGEITLYNNDTLLKQQEIIGNGENESFSYRADTAGTYFVAIGSTSDKDNENNISGKDPEEVAAIGEQLYELSIVKCIDCGGPPMLLTVEIIGPTSVMENSITNYTAQAYFDDDTYENVTNTSTWSENSSYAWFSSSPGGQLHTSTVSSNQTVTISVSYTFEGRTRSSSKTVTIKDFRLDHVTIIGDATIPESSSKSYTARAYFTDGSYTTPSSGVSWSENSSYATISSSGTLTASAVSGNKSVTITATYSKGGITKTGTKTVTILDSKTLTSLQVIGPSGILGGTIATYYAIAYFSDGTSSDVTYGCSWSGYAPYGSVIGNIVYSGWVPYTMWGNICAIYTYNGVTKSDCQSFSIFSL